MIDNTNQIREIVKVTGAKPTHPSAEIMISSPEFMEKIDKHAAEFKPLADKAFEKEFNGTGNYEMARG